MRYLKKFNEELFGTDITLFELMSAWLLYHGYRKYGLEGVLKNMGNNLKDWMTDFIEYSTTIHGAPVSKEITEYEFQRLLDKFKNRNLRQLKLSRYLITYNVTNYKASKEDWESSGYSSKWNSKDYEYLISANSKDEAKDKFEELWSTECDNFEPRPTLNIISIKLVNDKETIGSFKNKLNLF